VSLELPDGSVDEDSVDVVGSVDPLDVASVVVSVVVVSPDDVSAVVDALVSAVVADDVDADVSALVDGDVSVPVEPPEVSVLTLVSSPQPQIPRNDDTAHVRRILPVM
jgi:hypothetical protein